MGNCVVIWGQLLGIPKEGWTHYGKRRESERNHHFSLGTFITKNSDLFLSLGDRKCFFSQKIVFLHNG